MEKVRVIGIDLAVKSKHVAAVYDPAEGKFVHNKITFRPNLREMEGLLRKAREGSSEPVKLVAVMEATGMSWYIPSEYLVSHGVEVYRVNGALTKALRRFLSRSAGSDKIDSHVLAMMYPGIARKISPLKPPTGDQIALQKECKEYDRLRKEVVATKQRIASYDRSFWKGELKGVPSEAAWWLRGNWFDPWEVMRAGPEKIWEKWVEYASTHDLGLTGNDRWVHSWVNRAREIIEFHGEEGDYSLLQRIIVREQGELRRYESLMKEAKTRIIQMYHSIYPDSHLESIPGVGELSAACYMAFILDINRFPRVASFRLWAGVVPRSHDSGLMESKGLRMVKSGQGLIRATLYQDAEVARRYDPQLARVYYTQMVKYGKHHYQAAMAVASHLANRIYTVAKERRDYQLRDLDGKPITQKEASRIIQKQFVVPEEVRRRRRTRKRHR